MKTRFPWQASLAATFLIMVFVFVGWWAGEIALLQQLWVRFICMVTLAVSLTACRIFLRSWIILTEPDTDHYVIAAMLAGFIGSFMLGVLVRVVSI